MAIELLSPLKLGTLLHLGLNRDSPFLGGIIGPRQPSDIRTNIGVYMLLRLAVASIE
jgi:hypothetical protein